MQKWMLINKDHLDTGDNSLFKQWEQATGSLLWVDIQGQMVGIVVSLALIFLRLKWL